MNVPFLPAVDAAPRPFARAACAASLLAVAFVAMLRLAVAGVVPTVAAAVLAPVTLLALVAAVFRAGVALGPWAVDESGAARPLHRRHGFFVVALATVVSLPMLGAFSLVDPWETHYAEVAREMLERHDFVSPWWANEGFFMSKPVLTFWLEAASMKLFGVGTGPDAVLAAADGRSLHPEWAVRFPAFALALVGAYLLYHGVARTAGRRAGFFAGVALLTMPGYALLSRQALTDMPLVACTGASLGLLLRAFAVSPAVVVRAYELRIGKRVIAIHAGHAVALVVAILVLPQIVGLFAMHVRSFHFVADRLVTGSPHACGLPSQPPCTVQRPAHPWLAPALVASLAAPLAFTVVTSIAEERRATRLFAIGAWIFASLAAMAKGPAGLAVPAGAAVVVLFARSGAAPFLPRVRELLRATARLELARGVLVAVLLVAPWYLAVFGRNGRGYVDELVLRHMLGRTLDHLHDTNVGEDVGVTYFVKQLGWATFPWSGLLAAAFAALPFKDERSRRGLARLLFGAAAVLSFALVSMMRTKFHHYVLLGLPPCAAVVGLWLDERVAEGVADAKRAKRSRRVVHTAALVGMAAAVSALVLRDLATDGHARRFLQLLTYRYDRHWTTAAATSGVLFAFGAVTIIALATIAAPRLRAQAAMAFVASAAVFAALLLDVTLARGAKDGGQRGILEAYYRDAGPRPSRPLVAYQLNWKGENFYTGNHVAIFIASGAPMKRWLDAEKARGPRTFWFVTERGRTSTLHAELGVPIEVLTDERVSAEFALVRAEP